MTINPLEKIIIKLHSNENSKGNDKGITTLTFYDITSETSYEKVRDNIKSRFKKIIESNPFLKAKIVYQKGYQIEYNQKVTDEEINEMFFEKIIP